MLQFILSVVWLCLAWTTNLHKIFSCQYDIQFFRKNFKIQEKSPKIGGFPYLVYIYEKRIQENRCVRKLTFVKEMSKDFTDQNSRLQSAVQCNR